MSKNIWYRILAILAAVLLLAFAVMMSLVFATGKQVFIFLAGGLGGIGMIIWLGLTIIKKNMEKREELDKQFAEFEKNKNKTDEKSGQPVTGGESHSSAAVENNKNTADKKDNKVAAAAADKTEVFKKGD